MNKHGRDDSVVNLKRFFLNTNVIYKALFDKFFIKTSIVREEKERKIRILSLC
jgi:hypothetical protein